MAAGTEGCRQNQHAGRLAENTGRGLGAASMHSSVQPGKARQQDVCMWIR